MFDVFIMPHLRIFKHIKALLSIDLITYCILLSVTGSVPLGYSFCSAYDKIMGPFAVILQIPLGVIRSSGITGSARNESVTNGSI